ncbi:hypothetical protein [Sphingomonas oryzagri]|jgi:hypothetical protein|uniref:Uncharacterized protein n=1 Tax=Sphingomonas oryzagri TaxID=3042314 RepID=A0ABT6MZZ0_9SPHN|nr:hypothetical protein [Sphingomonas oryzagri]MDH7638557.1 hypothetical protein [Sphingomonas oryzagri]
MPFDPIDYRPEDPAPPGPLAPTDRHGAMVLILLALLAVLLTGLIEFPYTLDGLGRLGDAVGL